MRDSRVGIVSIATNKYLEFYFDLVTSFRNESPNFNGITFYLFTNRTTEAKKFAQDHNFPNIVIVKIQNLGWPDASLLRYKIFDENKAIFNTDILVYLDADMLILRDPTEEFALANEVMTFIRHPGFYYEFSLSFSRYVARNPKKILSLFSSLIKNGAVGAWDTQKFSTAHVSRRKRNHYYCGGVWFARKSTFLDFCQLLSNRTSLGLKRDHMPKWHDESYLNWYASEREHNELSPLFCADGIIDNLFSESPYLRAVDKPIQGFHGN